MITQDTLLTYGELEIGDKFINFPRAVDNYGGFRGGSNVYMKFSKIQAVDTKSGYVTPFSENREVIKVYV